MPTEDGRATIVRVRDGGDGGIARRAIQCDSTGICQQAGGTVGVRVYGDAHDAWVRTRPIWNQFDYHVTNIEYAGGLWNVPTHEDTNWLLYNNYRQNVQGGALFPAPDLQVDPTAAALCPSIVRLSAKVRNGGSAAAPAGLWPCTSTAPTSPRWPTWGRFPRPP